MVYNSGFRLVLVNLILFLLYLIKRIEKPREKEMKFIDLLLNSYYNKMLICKYTSMLKRLPVYFIYFFQFLSIIEKVFINRIINSKVFNNIDEFNNLIWYFYWPQKYNIFWNQSKNKQFHKNNFYPYYYSFFIFFVYLFIILSHNYSCLNKNLAYY